MSADKYDVLVVGAGPAGLAAAYKLALSGVEVVLIERGDYPGSKNLSGGVLYSRVMEKLMPNFWEEAPVERHINNYLTTFMTEEDSFTIDFKSKDLGQAPYNAFTVLRAKFDRWLADKAEEAGVMLITGIKVDELLKEGHKIVGIRAGEEEMLSDVVIAADGVNSFLAAQAGLRGPIKLEHLAVGAKELIELPREVIEERFHLNGDEGAAYALVGEATHGIAGGAFFYTNLESLSLGVVMRLDDLVKTQQQPHDVIEDLLEHPLIAPLVKDGQTIEYGAHLIAEGGLEMVPQLFTDGMLVVGEAAGFTINNGLVVRGMDLAIGSGIAAAEAVIQAKMKGDFSKNSLSAYRTILEQSFVMKDLTTYAKAPHFMENERLYKNYARFMGKMMKKIYTHDLTPKAHLMPVAMQAMKEADLSLLQLAKDGWKGVKAL